MIRRLPILGILLITGLLDLLFRAGWVLPCLVLGAIAGCLLSWWIGRRGAGWPLAACLALALGSVAIWGVEDVSFRRRLFILMQIGQAFFGTWLLMNAWVHRRPGDELPSRMNAAFVIVTFFATALAFHVVHLSLAYALNAAAVVLAAVQLDLVSRRRPQPGGGLTGWAGWLRLLVVLLTAIAGLLFAGLLAPPLSTVSPGGVRDAWHNWQRSHANPGGVPDEDTPAVGMVNAGGHELKAETGESKTRRPPHVAMAYLRPADDASAVQLAAQPLHLRLGAFDQFSNRTWSISMPRAELEDADDGRQDGLVTICSLPGPTVGYTVCTRVARQALLPGIPTLLAIQTPAAATLGNDTMVAPVEIREPFFCYGAVSRLIEWRDVAGGNPEMGDAESRYVRMEAGRLSSLIEQEVTGISGLRMGTAQAIDGIMRYLRQNCRYSLEVSNPQGLHPVENFLTADRRGHCELFATAFVLMARAAGVPARFCLGYCGGEYDRRQRLFVFYADDAHAWAEVYLEEYGWVTVDPTPPGASLAPKVAGSPVRLPREQLPWLDEIVAMERDPLLDSGHGWFNRRWAAEYSGSIVVFGVGTGLVVMVILLLARKRTAVGGGVSGAATARRRLPDFLVRFLRRYSVLGLPIRTGQTLGEYVRVLRDHGLLGKEYDDLIQYAHDVIYGACTRDPDREKEFRRRLRG
jgi:hypothetical protein